MNQKTGEEFWPSPGIGEPTWSRRPGVSWPDPLGVNLPPVLQLGGLNLPFIAVSSTLNYPPPPVPNTALTSLSVEAVVSTPTFNLPFVGLAGTRNFSSSVSQGVVREVPYRATAQPDRAFYDQGSTVTITGRIR